MRVAIYARVSTEKQERQETIQSQLQALRDYATKNNFALIQEYIDEGYSGDLLDRPALDNLRDDARRKQFDTLLVHSPDRLSRKYIYLGLLQEELKKYGVNIIFLNRPDSKDTPEEHLLNGVQGLIAEFEKAKIIERTRRGRMYKAKTVGLVGNRAPYGYRYIPSDKGSRSQGVYVLEETEASIVRLIFDLFLNKQLSIRAIARELTRCGIKPQRGKQWRSSSLHRILRNETYCGVTYYNKHMGVETDNHRDGKKYHRARKTSHRLRPKADWIPITLSDELKIITKETFEQAQAQLKKNGEFAPRNVKYPYLLRGLAFCGKCESPFGGVPMHAKPFYRCRNRHKTFPLPKTCFVPSVSANKLESAVWDAFSEAIRNPRLIAEQVAKLNTGAKGRKADLGKQIERIEKALGGIEGEESRLLDAYRENVITMEQLKDQMAKIQERKQILSQEKEGLSTKQETVINMGETRQTIKDYCRQVERKLDALKGDFEGRKYLLSLAINRIIVEGQLVRIKGVIPSYTEERPASSAELSSTLLGGCVRRPRQFQSPFLPGHVP